jgi:hypothetical protein
MALADRINTAAPTSSRFETWLDGLSPEHRALILKWATDPNVSTTRLWTAIREDDPSDGFVGYRANIHTIAAWRRTL